MASVTTSAPSGQSGYADEAPQTVPCVPTANAHAFAPTQASTDADGSVVLTLDTLASLNPSTGGVIRYRRLDPRDIGECETVHRALFPIKYEEAFYNAALGESDGIITLCAVERDFGGDERMVGVVTARVVPRTDEEDTEVVAEFLRRKRGAWGALYKAAVIGTRLHWQVSVACALMALCILFKSG